jgi:hypothetical protein
MHVFNAFAYNYHSVNVISYGLAQYDQCCTIFWKNLSTMTSFLGHKVVIVLLVCTFLQLKSDPRVNREI